ncbi:TPA: hypothetical protein F7068_06495 [Legionella pneumophila]|nr:hypothetical protein [Legionella pneumophila]HAT6380215.1 hypothetical protein [Legionella pneumophila]HAT8651778.1 hypothetical protein [Legionella pneumophila]HAU1148111.1 hypothetical protein [Legionella pneumophila]HAU2018352.1 hypothetical protein [Legionella pneumophila]
MVIDGISSCRIRNYLHRWTMWWTNTSTTWQYQELLQHFINVSWHGQVTGYATALSCRHQLRLLHTGSADELGKGYKFRKFEVFVRHKFSNNTDRVRHRPANAIGDAAAPPNISTEKSAPNPSIESSEVVTGNDPAIPASRSVYDRPTASFPSIT